MNLKNKSIGILGFGKEGRSNLSFLLGESINPKNIYIFDEKESLRDINKDVNLVLGKNAFQNIKKYNLDIIFKSPGISPYRKEFDKIKNLFVTQLQFFLNYYKGRAKIIMLTGTKGKSTISTLLFRVLENAGKDSRLVGNIGLPVLDSLKLNEDCDYIIIETSSYMLENLKKNNYISVLNNIYKDHLDWHKNFENYKNAKLNILSGSKYNIVNIQAKQYIDEKKYKGKFFYFGEEGKYTYKNNKFWIDKNLVFDDSGVKLKGQHNMYNISGILGVCDICGVDLKFLENTLNKFQGLKYRLESLGKHQGIEFINDANATTPQASLAALNAYPNTQTIILGGQDRGYDFQDLIKKIESMSIDNIIAFPDSGEKMISCLKNKNNYNILNTKSMKKAVEFAYKYTDKDRIVLLSCGSPSYSLWSGFEEKGDLYIKWVKELGT